MCILTSNTDTAVPLRQTFYIANKRRHDTLVSFKHDEVIVAATALALTFGGVPPNEKNMVFSAINSKKQATGPWMLSMPKECEANIAKQTFVVACIPTSKHPATMIEMTILVAKAKGENTMPAKPQHNNTFWANGDVSMDAAANQHVVAGLNKALRAAGVVNPRTKVLQSKQLNVNSTRVHIFFDGLSFGATSKETGWARLSKLLPYTIQANTKEYTLTIKTISPEVCVHYRRKKCCWKVHPPDTVCGCKPLQAAPPRSDLVVELPKGRRCEEDARCDRHTSHLALAGQAEKARDEKRREKD